MYYTFYTPKQEFASSRAVLLASPHPRSHKRPPQGGEVSVRAQSQFNTKSYNDALQRSFNHAKMQIYFNPDMQFFITLTYKKADNTIDEVLADMKYLVKKEKRNGAKNLKFIFIMEYQKRGSIHVHMIANGAFTFQKNRNGYQELKYWDHGFTSVLHINDFDKNFRPYLYLFKYMRKSQRIGKSFVHSSRNLNNFDKTNIVDETIFEQYMTKFQEISTTVIGENQLYFFRYFLEKIIDTT